MDNINGGRYYTGGPEDGNIFIGTQDNTYNLGSSRYLAGLIAHEGTHWNQKQGVRNFDKINWQ